MYVLFLVVLMNSKQNDFNGESFKKKKHLGLSWDNCHQFMEPKLTAASFFLTDDSLSYTIIRSNSILIIFNYFSEFLV